MPHAGGCTSITELFSELFPQENKDFSVHEIGKKAGGGELVGRERETRKSVLKSNYKV